MNRAIVIGGDHHNTLGMVRSLGSRGVYPDVYVVTNHSPSMLIVKSKFINKMCIFSTEKSLVDALFAERHHYTKEKPVLLIGGDKEAACIDSHYDKLKESYVFFNAGGNLSSLMNKETMSSLATEIGFNVPNHVVCHLDSKTEGVCIDELFGGRITFPCITKAISSLEGIKADTTICEKAEELTAFLNTPGVCKDIQIEQFIDKDIEFQFIGLSINRGETIIIPGHSHISRPRGIQNAYFFPYVENDDSFNETLVKTEKFIRKTGYSGLFSVEFLRGKDGKDYFLEMNFRNEGNAICVTDAGYNLPYLWYLYASGKNWKEEVNNSKFKTVNYCPERYHTMQCAYGEMTVYEWLRDLLKANSFTNYYKGDSDKFYWLRYTLWSGKWMLKKLLFRLKVKTPPNHNDIGGEYQYLRKKRKDNDQGKSDRR